MKGTIRRIRQPHAAGEPIGRVSYAPCSPARDIRNELLFPDRVPRHRLPEEIQPLARARASHECRRGANAGKRESHGRRVSRLTRDLHEGRTFGKKERAKEMPEEVGPRSIEASCFRGRSKDSPAPVAVRRFVPHGAVWPAEQERLRTRPPRCEPPIGEVGGEWRKQANRSRLDCLRHLHLSECDGLLDEDRPLPDVSPLTQPYQQPATPGRPAEAPPERPASARGSEPADAPLPLELIRRDADHAAALAPAARCPPLDLPRPNRPSAAGQRDLRPRAPPGSREPALGLPAHRWRGQRGRPESVCDGCPEDPP